MDKPMISWAEVGSITCCGGLLPKLRQWKQRYFVKSWTWEVRGEMEANTNPTSDLKMGGYS